MGYFFLLVKCPWKPFKTFGILQAKWRIWAVQKYSEKYNWISSNLNAIGSIGTPDFARNGGKSGFTPTRDPGVNFKTMQILIIPTPNSEHKIWWQTTFGDGWSTFVLVQIGFKQNILIEDPLATPVKILDVLPCWVSELVCLVLEFGLAAFPNLFQKKIGSWTIPNIFYNSGM